MPPELATLLLVHFGTTMEIVKSIDLNCGWMKPNDVFSKIFLLCLSSEIIKYFYVARDLWNLRENRFFGMGETLG